MRGPEDPIAAWTAAANDGDVDRMVSALHPDVVYVDRRQVGWPELRGREAVRAMFTSWSELADEGRSELELVQRAGPVLVIRQLWRFVEREFGIEAESVMWLVVSTSGPLVVRVDLVGDEQAARELARALARSSEP